MNNLSVQDGKEVWSSISTHTSLLLHLITVLSSITDPSILGLREYVDPSVTSMNGRTGKSSGYQIRNQSLHLVRKTMMRMIWMHQSSMTRRLKEEMGR